MDIFKLYACCIPVKGFTNYIICDLQRAEFINIPEVLFEILTVHKNKRVSEIKRNYAKENHRFIDEYFEYLENNECGFWCDIDEVKKFPDLNLKFESPELINNAILDIDKNSTHDYIKIFNELDKLRCKFIEIRSFDILRIYDLCEILHHTNSKIFRNIDIIIKYYKNIENDIDKNKLFSEFTNIGVVSIHSSPKNEKSFNGKLVYSERVIKTCNDCGEIDIDKFTLNIATFTEAQHFNTCLNKKVSIDSNGNIKNCPAFNYSYGNVNNGDSIRTIVESYEFSKYWSITKDQIQTCKDCEYRYICSDCRAFVDDIFDKPRKCNYNPYEGKWE